MTPAIKGSRTQEQRNAIAKRKLCRAALELFALQGYDATTLADIGVRAGYSRSLAQYHFANKTALAELLLEDMGQRALNTQVLRLEADTSGEEAMARLDKHLDKAWAHYCSMLDGSEANLAARGEMILNVTATFSPDPVLRDKLRQVSDVLTQHIELALERAIRDGVLRPGIEPRSVAIFYSSSIWGIASALFAAPQQREQLLDVVATLRGFIHSLRQQSVATPGSTP